MERTKRCSGCHQELPATADYFYRNAKRPDGLHGECKGCHRERSIKFAHANRAKRVGWHRAWVRRLRVKVLEHYSGGDPKCAWCEESHAEFLVLDHINGGGAQHRKVVGGGSNMWRWLQREGFPEGFRVLCHNCNASFGTWGYCPHQKESEEAG